MTVSSRIAETTRSYFTQQENTMTNSSSYTNTFAALLTVALVLSSSSKVSATQIGPGAGLAGATSADGNGGRTNVELDFVNLAAGDYNVLDFEFNAVNTSGTVQPFLAELTTVGPRQFTPLWVGPTYAPGATGSNTDTYPLGGEQFALSVATDVYVGFVMTATAVGFAGGGSTDHQGTPPLTPIVNTELVAFTSQGLGRTYAFAVNVEEFVPPVPEPSTFVLAALGLLGLTRLRRRRR